MAKISTKTSKVIKGRVLIFYSTENENHTNSPSKNASKAKHLLLDSSILIILQKCFYFLKKEFWELDFSTFVLDRNNLDDPGNLF